MTTIKAVIFDNFHVLMSHPPANEMEKCRRELAEELGISYEQMMELVAKYSPDANLGFITPEELWRSVCWDAGDSREKGWTHYHRLSSHYWQSERVEANHLLLDYVKSLRQRSFKTALLSNAWNNIFRIWYRLGLRMKDYFDQTIISCDVHLQKPDSQIYWLALSKLDSAPEEVVFVDDCEENVRAAQALGMKGVVFKSTIQLINIDLSFLCE